MKTATRSSHPILSQTCKNTTLWIGHLKTDTTDHFAGQTFSCPTDGLLNNIQVYSSTVTNPGDLAISVHEFDPIAHVWGPAIGNARLHLASEDEARWIRFELDPVTMHKGRSYGFRLFTNDAFIGVGEAAAEAKNPFAFGQAWYGDTNNQRGHYYNYFSLAFKVELCA